SDLGPPSRVIATISCLDFSPRIKSSNRFFASATDNKPIHVWHLNLQWLFCWSLYWPANADVRNLTGVVGKALFSLRVFAVGLLRNDRDFNVAVPVQQSFQNDPQCREPFF